MVNTGRSPETSSTQITRGGTPLRRLLRLPWPAIAITVLLLDQVTKLLAEQFLIYHQPVPLIPLLNLTLSYNTGAAFSFLGDADGWQRWLFSGFAAVVSVIIVTWLRRLPPWDRWMTWGLSLLLGGAVGNLIDRLLHGHVIDFVHLYYDRWSYPIFNIADIGITLGAVMILIHAFFLDGRQG